MFFFFIFFWNLNRTFFSFKSQTIWKETRSITAPWKGKCKHGTKTCVWNSCPSPIPFINNQIWVESIFERSMDDDDGRHRWDISHHHGNPCWTPFFFSGGKFDFVFQIIQTSFPFVFVLFFFFSFSVTVGQVKRSKDTPAHWSYASNKHNWHLLYFVFWGGWTYRRKSLFIFILFCFSVVLGGGHHQGALTTAPSDFFFFFNQHSPAPGSSRFFFFEERK